MTVESKMELRSIFNLKKIFFVLLGNTIYCAGIGRSGIGRIVYVRFSDPDRSDVLPGYRKESVWDPARDDLYSACG